MFGRSNKDARRGTNQRRTDSRGKLLQVSARNGEKARDRAHKTSAIVVLLVAVAGVGWAAVAGTEVVGRALFSQNDQFIIQRLDVSSNGRLRPEHVREYGKIAEGLNLFAVDIDLIRANLESVPLIRSVEIKRDLPDTLMVRVTERAPLARLAEGPSGLPVLVDRDGYVLGLGRQSNLPVISGVQERGLGPGSMVREQGVLDALDLLDLCDTTRLGSVIHIQTIDVRDPDRLVLNLAGGEAIPMGRDQLKVRLEKLADTLKTAQELGRTIQTADLTVLRNVPVVYRTP